MGSNRRILLCMTLAFLLGLGARWIGAQVSVMSSGTSLLFLRVLGGSATLAQEGLFVPGSGRLGFSTGGTQQWEIDQSGDLITTADNTENLGAISGARPATGYFGTAVAVGDDPASAGAFRLASTSAIQWRNKTGSGNLPLLQTDLADTMIIGSQSGFLVLGATASGPAFRIPNATGAYQARNAAGSGTIDLIKSDAANTVIVASGSQITLSVASASPVPNTGLKLLCVSATTGKVFFGTTVNAFGCN